MHKILYGNCHIGLQWFVRKRCIHVMMYLWLKTRNTMYTRSPLWFESLPFSQILGGIGGPKKIIWDSRKKTERSEGKICRVWTTCWAPVDSMEGRGDPVGVVDEPPNHWRASGGSGLGMCRGDCDWQSVSGTFDSVDSPGAIETTNGEKGAQVLMPIQSERHLVE